MCEQDGEKINWARELKIGDKIDMIFEVDVNEWKPRIATHYY